jgi:hypothetical protein
MSQRNFPQAPTPEEIEESRRVDREAYEFHRRTFATLEGAGSLIALYGHVPSFHDGEITDLNLRRKGESKLRVSINYPDNFGHGSVFVTLEITNLLDVEIEGFSAQNVIDSLYVTPAIANAEREAHYGIDRMDGDLRIEFDPIWGVGGHLICRGVRVVWTMDHIARKLPRPTPPRDL